MIRFDPHGHGRTGSYFLPGEPRRIARTVRARLGRFGIWGLTDFNDNRYERFWTSVTRRNEALDIGNGLYFPDEEIYIVHAQEVPDCEDRHVWIGPLATNAYVESGLGVAETVNAARSIAGGYAPLVIAAHPSSRWGHGMFLDADPENAALFDGIEVHNEAADFEVVVDLVMGLFLRRSRGTDRRPMSKMFDRSRWRTFNQRNGALYERLVRYHPDLTPIITSDSHSIRYLGGIGTSWLWLPDIPEDFLGPRGYISESDKLAAYLRWGLTQNRREGLGGRARYSLVPAFFHAICAAGIYVLNDMMWRGVLRRQGQLLPAETRSRWLRPSLFKDAKRAAKC